MSGIGSLNFLGELDPKAITELSKMNKTDLFLSYYPNYKSRCEDMLKDHNEFCTIIQSIFNQLNLKSTSLENFCQITETVVPKPIDTILRKMRTEQHVSIRSYLSTLIYKAVGWIKPFKAFLKMKQELIDLEKKLQLENDKN